MDGGFRFGVGGCKLLHLEWIGSGLLLYSTRNGMWLGHFAVQQKLTECCKSTLMEKVKNHINLKKIKK